MSTLKEELDQLDREIADLMERRNAIYLRSLDAPEADKACPDFFARMLGKKNFKRPPPPQEKVFTRLVWGSHEVLMPHPGPKPRWVSVRPCGADDKTYLGIYIGEVALSASAHHDPGSGVLSVSLSLHNPAMYVPDLGRVVFGCGSWWRDLETPQELADITDADIEGVWYVRALRDLGGREPEATSTAPSQT